MPGINTRIGIGINRHIGAFLNQKGSLVGIDPSNTATQNATAFNTALSKGNITVDIPGVYELNNTIFIPSNRTLTFVIGCTIKKASGSAFSHVFANKGILTREWNSNININGNGLIVDVNAIDGMGTFPIVGLRGQIAFFQVNNLNIDGITTTTTGLTQFFLHPSEVYGSIDRPCKWSNLDIQGWKDAIHCGVMSDILMEDIRTCSGDDGIALNGWDLAVSNPTLGHIQRVTIRRWKDDLYEGQGGSGCYLLSGSWKEWVTGSTYLENDVVVNNGNIYQKNQIGSAIASIAPVHLSGEATGADGIKWIWRQLGTLDHCDIKDITIENPVWNSNRKLVRTAGATDQSRSTFPGTGIKSIVDNIVIDNPTFSTNSTEGRMAWIDVNAGNFTIKNSNLILPDTKTLIAIIPRPDTFSIKKIIFDNCNITLQGSSKLAAFTVMAYPYNIEEIAIINGSVINTPDTSRAAIFNLIGNMLSKVTLNNSMFSHVVNLINTESNAITCTINADNCVFKNTISNLIRLFHTAGNVLNFNANACSFGETTDFMFFNDRVESQINVTTTNSTGEPIPLLASGTVNITGSDLKPVLGSNIVSNGRFIENVVGWTGGAGAISWDASGCLKFTANGSTNPGISANNVVNSLSGNVRLSFKAKSPNITNTLRSAYNPNSLTAVTNPPLSPSWQTYVFQGVRGGAVGPLYILTTGNIINYSIFYIDDVTVIQY